MSENKPRKVWTCYNCKIFFYPSKQNFRCPNCNNTSTAPSSQYDPSKHTLWIPPEPITNIDCPRCSKLMSPGFIVETNSPIDLGTWGAGVYWTPFEEGTIGTRVPLMAYACSNCGHVEIKIRNLRKHEIKIKASLRLNKQ